MEKRWTSLCKVNRPDKNQDIWMVRIADIFNGTLKLTNFDEKREKIQDNRQLAFGNGQNDKQTPENGFQIPLI